MRGSTRIQQYAEPIRRTSTAQHFSYDDHAMPSRFVRYHTSINSEHVALYWPHYSLCAIDVATSYQLRGIRDITRQYGISGLASTYTTLLIRQMQTCRQMVLRVSIFDTGACYLVAT